MGTDIHPMVQVKEGDAWNIVQMPLPVYDAVEKRNYALFPILAGVRNWDESVTPIAMPRGLPAGVGRWPEDANVWMLESVVHELGRYDKPEDETYLGEHSFSWLTLGELEGFPWNERLPKDWRDAPSSKETFAQRCSEFYGVFLPWLRTLATDGRTSDDVRFVFGFDN